MMADHGRAGGGASWKLNIYWLPERSLELDPFRCFANRLGASWRRSARRPACWRGAEPPRFVCADARGLAEHVPDGAAAYAFADPPYGGEGIQYARAVGALVRLARAGAGAGVRRGDRREPAPRPRPDGVRERAPGRFSGGAPRARAGRADDGHVRLQRPAVVAGARCGAGGRGLPRPRCDRVRALGAGADGANVAGATRTDAWLECVRVAAPFE